MLPTMRKSKSHRARVTHADLNHVGSVTIDADHHRLHLGDDPAYVPDLDGLDVADLVSPGGLR